MSFDPPWLRATHDPNGTTPAHIDQAARVTRQRSVGHYRQGRVRTRAVRADQLIAGDTIFFAGVRQQIRLTEIGPDGLVYLTTTHTVGRMAGGLEPDYLVRVIDASDASWQHD